MKKIKTAVIGAGNMGDRHARIYSEISRLVAVADINPEIGHKIASRYNVNFYQNYKEMIDKEKPEAISVVVPTEFHSNVAIDCLEKKIPILLEKPIAQNLAQARKIIAKAKESKTVLMVGHIERFNPAVMALKEIMKEKKLGTIISLLAIRVGINPPKVINADVSLDLAIHDIDIFNYLLNSFPNHKKIINHKVYKNNKSDASVIVLEYPSTTGIIQTNWITPIKIRKLLVTGSRGYCELDYIKQELSIYNNPVHITNDGGFSNILSLSNNPKKNVFVSMKEPLREEISYFLKNKDNIGAFDNGIYAYKALEVLQKK